jgi:hypothetical protein
MPNDALSLTQMKSSGPGTGPPNERVLILQLVFGEAPAKAIIGQIGAGKFRIGRIVSVERDGAGLRSP